MAIKEYQTVREISGPILFVDGVGDAAYNETVEISLPSGERKKGQVLETSKSYAAVQVFGSTQGLDTKITSIRFTGETLRLPVSEDMLGRVFNGLGEPIDKGPTITSREKIDIQGSAINPYSRAELHDFIQTGVSTIDALNTLVRGQKLPIFSAAGLPHNELAVQIARQATVRGKGEKEDFVVIFAAMGITNGEASFFMRDFEKTGALERSVLFLNLANDPSIERLITPRMALTTAEYLAFERDMQVLVILTDMTNYADALRELAAARQEVPGRRGYPGYMYSVDGSRRVIVKDPLGTIRVVELRELFEFLKQEKTVTVSLDSIEERIFTPKWEALSSNAEGTSEFKPLKQILRHKYKGRLIKITTQAGETIVTPNHSVFIVKNGSAELALSQELQVGDLVAHVNKVPTISKASISPALATLSGYYVSEGHATKYVDKESGALCHYLRIDNNNAEFALDVREKLIETFGKYPSTFVSDKRSGTIRSSIGGKTYYTQMVEQLCCGTNSHTKRIPSQIFTSPPEIQEAFLESYYKGDGKAQDPRYKTRQYDMVTVSDGLRDDLMTLSKIMFPDRIPTFYKWKGRNAWKVYLSTFLKGKHEKVNDIIGAEIKNIEWVEPTEEWVYDLSVEDNQNFVDACGGILLHNTDLASIYERAGAVKGKKGTVTQLPILSMPEEDITHPIPDLTGYITEGQIVLSRDLYRKNIYPCVDVLPSLSRLMSLGIGGDKTREDHAGISSQLYASYAEGRDLRNLVAVVGEEALTERDKKFLHFADAFEKKFVTQGKYENRTIEDSLELGWQLAAQIPEAELKRVKPEHIEKYGKKYRK